MRGWVQHCFFCKDQFGSDINIKMFVAFSVQDAGKGNAIFWLTQHFGVFPKTLRYFPV